MRTLIIVLCMAVLAGGAAAEPVVLAVDGNNAYVDLGARDGVGAGTELELVREVVVTDPVSGKTLRDRFALGTLTVARAGEKVCEAVIESGLRGRVKAGDTIRVGSAERAFADPWAESVQASKRAADPGATTPVVVAGRDPYVSAQQAADAATAAGALWKRTLGQRPGDRAALWREFLTEHPGSPYAATIRVEIASLERQAAELAKAIEAAGTPSVEPDRRPALADALAELAGRPAGPLWPAVPTRVSPGRPIAVSFAIVTELTGTPWLYVREAGARAFTRTALTPDGDGYLRATIPAEAVHGDGLAWYVAAGDRPILGDEVDPRRIQIDRDLDDPPPAEGRTTIHTSLDYVDFDGGLEDGYDQYYQAEVDAAYRFLKPIHTVRLGFGTMSGAGGPKDVIDEDPLHSCLDGSGTFRCRAVTFSYVFTELELHPRKQIAIMLRPQAGVVTTDSSPEGGARRCSSATELDKCNFFTGFGFRARVRIGEEVGTNLELGAGFTDGIGTLFEALYHWSPTKLVPVQLAVQVTDMPVPEDFGVRLLADVGWRGMSWVYPSLRVSYQARDIDHVGVSGGFGLNFDW